jgi:hypothetical protein
MFALVRREISVFPGLVSHSFFKIRPICEMVAHCAVHYRAKQREEMFFAFSKGSRGCTGKKYVYRCYFLAYDEHTLTIGNLVLRWQR